MVKIYKPVMFTPMDRRATLLVAVGLPGAGKTTGTLEWLAQQASSRYRVGLDDFRASQGYTDVTEAREGQEELNDYARELVVRGMLRAGVDVTIDTTNLQDGIMNRWRTMATECGADFEIVDYTVVPLAVCLERNRHRGEQGGRLVDEDVIREIARLAGLDDRESE